LFGRLSDGREVYSYTLRNENGMKVKLMNYGAAVMQIKVPDRYGCFTDVVGGYDCIESYVGADGFQGATVGRCANRISTGGFTIDGVRYELSKNNGEGHIHGGFDGFDAKLWSVTELDSDEPEIVFGYISKDGEEGYPGRLDVKVTYKLLSDNALSINFKATTDKKTIVNLINHSFFNLNGQASGNALKHKLQINSKTIVPVDEKLCSYNVLQSAEKTVFDFTPYNYPADDDTSD
jgi:aldose 1-epimerase